MSRMLRCYAVIAIVISAASVFWGAGPDDKIVAPRSFSTPALTAVAGQAIMNSHAYDYLQELSDDVGPRLTGSPGSVRAIEWGMEKMKGIGLTNVHTEKWQLVRGWTRVTASATLLEPIRRDLHIDSNTFVGSTAGPVEAEVVTVNMNQLEKEMKENATKWQGKILLLVARGPRSMQGMEGMDISEKFLRVAYESHAVALLGSPFGGVSTGMNLTHSGAVGFQPSYDIAIASLTAEDQLQLERFLGRGKTMRMKIDIQNRFTGGPVETANVVGEITGSESPEQVVVVGGHLDSMDFAPGTTDDGIGVATTLGSAEAILASGYKPKRTIRFVLFMGEEQGLLGSLAYTRTHKDELQNHLAAVILDNGQGLVSGFNLGGRDDLVETVKKFSDSAKAFGPLKVDTYMSFGTDAGPFILAGLPGINLSQSSPEYGFTHHSVVDTFDKVKPEILLRDTAVMALTAFWIADQPERFAAPWAPERTAKALADQKMDGFLKAAGLWTFGDLGKPQNRTEKK